MLRQVRSIKIYITLIHGFINEKQILILVLVNKHWRSYLAVKQSLPLIILNLFSTRFCTRTLNSKASWNVSRFQVTFSRTFLEHAQ